MSEVSGVGSNSFSLIAAYFGRGAPSNNSEQWIPLGRTYVDISTNPRTIYQWDGVRWQLMGTITPSALQFITDSGTFAPDVNGNVNLLGQNVAGSGIQTSGTADTGSWRMISPYALESFSFSRSAPGATNQLAVVNSSNTANSQARLLIQQGGTLAGDAYTQLEVTGLNIWTYGLDRSDNAAMVFSVGSALGTNNVLRLSTNGWITMPLQPSFLGRALLQSNVVGLTATTYTVVFATQVFDRNSDFDGTTFTAPVTGLYQFNVTITMSGLAVTNDAGTITLVTTARSYVLYQANWGAIMTSGNVVTVSGSVLADMTIGDTATVTVNISGAADTVDINATSTTFSGKLDA